MYYYNKKILFESNEYTSLKIEESDERTLTYNPTTRQVVVTLPSGATCSELEIVKEVDIIFTPEEMVDFGVFLCRRDELTLKGVRYYFVDGIERFSQLYNEELGNQIVVDNGMYFVSLSGSDLITSFDDYAEMVNTDGNAYVELVDESAFDLVNFYDLSVYSHYNSTSDDKTVAVFDEIEVSPVDAQAGFNDWVSALYPDVEVGPELSDLTKIKNKTNGYLMINHGMYQTGQEFTVHPLRHPVMRRTMAVQTPTEFEYLTDDLAKLHQFRDDFYLERGLFSNGKYEFTDRRGRRWNAQAFYQYASDAKLDRSPASRYLTESNLYSFKFFGDLCYWIVQAYRDYPILEQIISRVRDSAERVLREKTHGAVNEGEY